MIRRVVSRVSWRRDRRGDSVGLPPATAGGTFRALRNRNYRLFYTGQIISLCGTWMQTVAQALLVIEITDSKVALGTVTMLQFLPITIFVLFAGVIADRVPKRRFILLTRTLAMAQAFALTALVWSGHVELWHVYSLALVLGLSNAFEQPTRQAFIIEMVGRDDLMNAVALNSGMFNAARLVGPAIGGLIIAAFGLEWAFLLNGLSFFPVIIGLLMIDTSQLHARARTSPLQSPLVELREGLAYAFSTPSVLLVVILVAMIGTFGYNFTVMLPLISEYVLDRGAAGLGFMTSAVGLGAMMSALLLASRTRVTIGTLFGGGAAFGVLLIVLAGSEWFALTLVLLWGVGMASTAFSSTANTWMQLAAPDHLRGRVMGLYMLLFAGSTPIGGFFMGITAERFGVGTAIALYGLLCLAGVAAGLAYYAAHRTHIESASQAATS